MDDEAMTGHYGAMCNSNEEALNSWFRMHGDTVLKQLGDREARLFEGLSPIRYRRRER
jgi:hypothetical protein